MTRRVRIGQIINTQGVRGDVRVYSLTDWPERFQKLQTVTLEKDGQEKTATITGVRYHKQFVILSFAEVTDMNQAEALKGYYLTVPEEEAVELPEDTYFHYQLEGMAVYTETGELLGSLREIIETGANDVYVIQREGGRDLLLPAIKDVIKAVDVANRRMTVHLLEGLAE